MLAPQIDVNSLANAYRQNQALVISNVLEAALADRLHEALLAADWFLEIKDYRQSDILRVPVRDVPDRDHLLGVLDNVEHGLDTGNLFFMRLALADSEFADTALQEFRRYMDGGEFIDTLRRITGHQEIVSVWAEATCYEKCCFLAGHRDDHHPDNVVAFVLNLSREWQVDWGGLLMLQSPGMPPFILPPLFNSLSLFTVPRDHHVSAVSPAVTGQRLSITGWLRKAAVS